MFRSVLVISLLVYLLLRAVLVISLLVYLLLRAILINPLLVYLMLRAVLVISLLGERVACSHLLVVCRDRICAFVNIVVTWETNKK